MGVEEEEEGEEGEEECEVALSALFSSLERESVEMVGSSKESERK